MATQLQWKKVKIGKHTVRYQSTKRHVVYNNADLSKLLLARLPLDLPPQKLFQGRHVTMRTIKSVMNKSYSDKIVADVMKKYSPFEDTSKARPPQYKFARIRLVGMDITFVVQKCCIYLESSKSLALMGRATKSLEKSECLPSMLRDVGLDPAKSILNRREQTFISLEAMKVLIQNDCTSKKRSILIRLFDHMESRIKETRVLTKKVLADIEEIDKTLALGKRF